MCQMFKLFWVSNVRFQFAVNFYRMQKIETNYKDDIFRSKTFQLKFLLLQRKKYLKFHSCTERKKDKIFLLLPYYNEYIMFTSPFVSDWFRLKLFFDRIESFWKQKEPYPIDAHGGGGGRGEEGAPRLPTHKTSKNWIIKLQ